MEYKVTRTSQWDCDENHPPCEGAVHKDTIHVDERTFKSEAEHDAIFNEKWRDRGANHGQKENGNITREFPSKDWVIEIKTLEELRDFVNKYGKIVLKRDEIEIYDDYRE